MTMRHYWHELTHTFWYRDAYKRLLDALPEDEPTIWVEVGVYHGAALCWLGVEALNRHIDVHIHAVDTFAGWPGVAQGDALFDSFARNTHAIAWRLRDRFAVHRKSSIDAAFDFARESCDVVWIDAEHTYEAVSADLAAWWPNVRPGGAIGGDDWAYGATIKHDGDVARAVRDYFDARRDGVSLTIGYGEREGEPWPYWIVRKALTPEQAA